MRPRSLLFALAAVSACLCSCTTRRARPETIVIVQAEGPQSLEPCENNEDFSANVLGNVFEPLVAMDANLNLTPALASSWYTPDPTTWVFKLRAGARWQDGRQVTTAEVVASLERARSDPKSRRRPELSQIITIAARDTGEVVLKTRAPLGALASQIAQVPLSRPATEQTRFPVGTGPYRIEGFTPGGNTLLTPSNEAATLHPLLFRAIPDRKTRMQMLQDGRAHILPYLSPAESTVVGLSAKTKVISGRGLLIAFLAMDYARAHTPYVISRKNPFRDIRVRRAVESVIDREALLADALDGRGAALSQLVVPESFGYSPLAPRPVPNLALAKALMAEAGRAGGFDVALDYEGVAVEDSMERVVKVLVRQFAQIGLRIRPKAYTTQQLLARVESRDTSFYLLSWVGTSGDFGSTAEFLLRTPSHGRGTDNGGGYSSPEADALMDAASATLDLGARLDILRKLEERIRIDVPVIPLLRREDAYGVAAGVSFEPRLDREIRGATLIVAPK
jgi:peptide/nickel transport system substrate-binding protein